MTAVTRFDFFGREIFLKREDQTGDELNGNKFRKLHSLLNGHCGNFSEIVSCGGTQSNAMLALAIAAQRLKIKFHYFTRTMPEWLQKNPIGNLKKALESEMEIFSVGNAADVCAEARSYTNNQMLFMPQGIAHHCAEEGLHQLAQELHSQVLHLHRPALFLAGGTNTTAYFLAQHLDPRITLFVIPVAEPKLRWPFDKPPVSKVQEINLPFSLPFGKPDARVLRMYHQLKDSGVEFDLLYDSPAWLALRHRVDSLRDYDWIYLHGGGLEGNPSMLQRYRYSGLISND